MTRESGGAGFELRDAATHLREQALGLALAAALAVPLYWRIVADMASQWSNDANYSHGFLVPFISAYLFYERREAVAATRARFSAWGLGLVACALAFLVAGSLAIEYFSMRMSLVLLVMGVVLYCFGWETFRSLALPLGYLAFMVPLPYILYDAASFPLKLFVTKVSVQSLSLLGVPVLREGNILHFSELTLEVADACSGLRSLMSLLALGVACAFLFLTRPLNRIAVVALAVPIAVATNALRVIATGLLGQRYGAAAATGFFHEFAGFTVFGFALVLMGATIALLKRRER